VAVAINDAGNGSTSSGGTEENWLKNAAAARSERRSFYQGNRVFAENPETRFIERLLNDPSTVF